MSARRWSPGPGVVRGRYVVTPQGLRPASIHIYAGRIVRVSEFDDTGSPGQDVLDAEELCVLPGLVDTHVHINEPGRADWEGFATATAAAAAGGVTTVLDMPLNSVPATTNVRALERKRRTAAGKCRVDVGFLGGVVPGNAAELAPLWHAGVFAFKCFLVPSGVDEFRHVEAPDLERALRELTRLGGSATLMVHAELSGPLESALGALRHEDPRQYATYLASRPPGAETEAIRFISELGLRHRTPIHIVHLSAAESLAIVREARDGGVAISAETCPHYLAISTEQIVDGATEFKCAPPIRSDDNRRQLWEGLESDTIELVVSDHSPCPPALKRKDSGDFFAAWGGISSLELTLAVVWSGMRERQLSVERLARWMAQNPARLVGLEGRKGAIVAGADADLAVVDLASPFVVDARALQQRHKLTPYDRRELYGRVMATYLRGSLIYADGKLVGEPSGRLLSRTS